MPRLFILAAAMFALAGCAQRPIYEWGSYSQSLLDYAKNPQETRQFADRLRKDIDKAERTRRVPPGMYAELGFVLVEMGEDREAITWFAKERERWPESAVLMTRLIDRLSGAPGAKSPDGAAAPSVQN